MDSPDPAPRTSVGNESKNSDVQVWYINECPVPHSSAGTTISMEWSGSTTRKLSIPSDMATAPTNSTFRRPSRSGVRRNTIRRVSPQPA